MEESIDNSQQLSWWERHKRLKITLVTLLLVIALFDFVMALWAFNEMNKKWSAEAEWVETSVELISTKPEATRSIILVHGFGGSPHDYRPLAEKLHNRGFRLVLPIIPGQQKHSLAYNRGSYTDEFYINWLEELVEQETKRYGKKPYLIGFSMGGALSTVIAAQNKIDKLVLLAPFYSLPTANGFLWSLSRVVSLVVPIVPKFSKGRINDPEGYKDYMPGTFMVSLGAFHQLELLAGRARKVAKDINVPTLVIGSSNDKVASFAVTKKLFEGQAKIVEFTKANHVVLYDYDRDKMIEEIIEFLVAKDKE